LIRRRLLLALGGSIATVGLLEIALRLYATWTLRERGLTYHAEFGWAYLPNIRKRGRYWSGDEPAWTNSRGWRDEETRLERRPGKRRIVALGDSFTFGVAVDYGERFSELLERDVEGLEVVNLGINASGTDQHLRVLEVGEGVVGRHAAILPAHEADTPGRPSVG